MVTPLAAVRDRLEAAGIPDAAFEAAQLYMLATGRDARLSGGAPLSAFEQKKLDALCEKRCARFPLQYLCGEWDFLDLTLKVGPGVLIPRADTEVLAEQALSYVKSLGECRVLDLCAGSGCIGLAVASQAPKSRVVLGEWSEGALKICRQNIRRTGLTGRVVPMQVDARERPDRSLGEFQCIISNPPYIPQGDLAGLEVSVRDYEPHLALDGGEDGLDFYRTISGQWKNCLMPGGRLYFEVGIGQADSVLRIMRTQGFGDIQVVKDLHDIPRVVFGTLCTEI